MDKPETDPAAEWYGRLAELGGAYDAGCATASATMMRAWRDKDLARILGPAIILAATLENAALFPEWLAEVRARYALPEGIPAEVHSIFAGVMVDVRELLVTPAAELFGSGFRGG